MMVMKRRKNKAGRITAWLITWDGMGSHSERNNKIAAVLNYRLPPQRIIELVEIIYANEYYNYKERIAIAKDRKLNPYKATFDDIEGIPWQGRIFCGHNPWLEARLVDNLYILKDSDGNENLSWEERTKPDVSWMKRIQ